MRGRMERGAETVGGYSSQSHTVHLDNLAPEKDTLQRVSLTAAGHQEKGLTPFLQLSLKDKQHSFMSGDLKREIRSTPAEMEEVEIDYAVLIGH